MPCCCRRRHEKESKASLKGVIERCSEYVDRMEQGKAETCGHWRADANDETSPPHTLQTFPRVKVTSKASLLDTTRRKNKKVSLYIPVNEVAAQPQLLEKDIDAKLEEATCLCRQSRLFEAYDLIEPVACLGRVQSKISSEPLLRKLLQVHDRFQGAIKQTMTPALRTDVTWRTITVKDPKIHKDWSLEFSLRHADESEFQKGGPSSQVIIKSQMFNYPLSLAKYMSLCVEIDQVRKDWIEDCDFMSGVCGGEAQLYEGCCQMVIASALMPFHLQETMVRAISYCAKPPFDPGCLGKGAGQGILTVESNPPDGVKEWEGWTLPPDARKKVVKLSGTVKTIYAMPGDDPSLVHIFAASRLHLPVRPFLLPLDMAKRIIADLFRKSIARIKKNVFDKWQDYEFDARRKKNPTLYKQFQDEICGASSGKSILF